MIFLKKIIMKMTKIFLKIGICQGPARFKNSALFVSRIICSEKKPIQLAPLNWITLGRRLLI